MFASNSARRRDRSGSAKPREGHRVRDRQSKREGEILDRAARYLRPNAPPIHVCLIRWDDGLIEAVSEEAFRGSRWCELLVSEDSS